MKSKLAALAACLLLGGLAGLAQAQAVNNRACVVSGTSIACGTTVVACHCISGSSSVVTPQNPPFAVVASWCRDRGPTC
jgi:hypothetical protein